MLTPTARGENFSLNTSHVFRAHYILSEHQDQLYLSHIPSIQISSKPIPTTQSLLAQVALLSSLSCRPHHIKTLHRKD